MRCAARNRLTPGQPPAKSGLKRPSRNPVALSEIPSGDGLQAVQSPAIPKALPASHRLYHWLESSRQREGCMTRQTFGASFVCVWGLAAIGSVVCLSAGQQNTEIPAAARNYWAFKLPVQAALPSASIRFENPIDRFLEAARQERGLAPAPRAARLTLLRRACLDLTGLPPSPAESAAFLADDTPGSWERLIDTLLASPRYGERWGRH